jgi:hypothetical protein
MITMNTKSIIYKTLDLALSLKRPHKSKTNKQFTEWLANALPEHLWDNVHIDEVGNLHVDARINPTNRTLFVAHVDTVHKTEGKNKITKTKTEWKANGAPLGADDGAGVAMLMHLIHGGVAAYYIFTQGEECGGIGATHIATQNKTLLAQFDRAIAFDRRGIDSVITHQGWSRCCSDVFAQALADEFNGDDRLMYLPDDTGVYTDTAEFVDIIPECTNISVGYYSEHSDKESLDIVHFQTLASQVLAINWDALPTDRDPTIKEDKSSRYDYVGVAGWSSGYSAMFSKPWGGEEHDLAEYMRYELEDALRTAQDGDYEWLLEMMAESVYPEDMDLAVRFIDKRKLTFNVLDDALYMLESNDPDAVLATLFDEAYATV